MIDISAARTLTHAVPPQPHAMLIQAVMLPLTLSSHALFKLYVLGQSAETDATLVRHTECRARQP